MPYCIKCGKEMAAGVKDCPYCGQASTDPIGPSSVTPAPAIPVSYPWGQAVGFQIGERVVQYSGCSAVLPTSNAVLTEVAIGNGYFVLTNQRVFYAAKKGVAGGLLFSSYEVTFSTRLEDISAVSVGRFMFKPKLVLLGKNGKKIGFTSSGVEKLLNPINAQMTARSKELHDEREKERTMVVKHVVLDFSSLKELMANGGIQMTMYKCPKCGGTLNLPDSGQLLVCGYCGMTVKPVDVFEKIKELL